MNQSLSKRYLRVKTCNFSSKTNSLFIYNNDLMKNMNSETLVKKDYSAIFKHCFYFSG